MADIRSEQVRRKQEAQLRRTIESKRWQDEREKDQPSQQALFGPPIKVKPDSGAKQIAAILGDHNSTLKLMTSSTIGVDRNPSTPGVASKFQKPNFPKAQSNNAAPQVNHAKQETASKLETTEGALKVKDSSSSAKKGTTNSNSRSRPEESKHKIVSNRSSSVSKQHEKSSHERKPDRSRESKERNERSRNSESNRNHKESSTSSRKSRDSASRKSSDKTPVIKESPSRHRNDKASASHNHQMQHPSNTQGSKSKHLTLSTQDARKQTMDDILKETTSLQPPLTAIQTPHKEDGFHFKEEKLDHKIQPASNKPAPKRSKKALSPKSSDSDSSSEGSGSDSNSSDSDSSDEETNVQSTVKSQPKTTPSHVDTSTPTPTKPPVEPEEDDQNFSFNIGKLRAQLFNNGPGPPDISPTDSSIPDVSTVLASSGDKSDGLDKCVEGIVQGHFFDSSMISPLNQSGVETGNEHNSHVEEEIDEVPTDGEAKPGEDKGQRSCMLDMRGKVFGLARSVPDVKEEVNLSPEPHVFQSPARPTMKSSKKRSSSKTGDSIPQEDSKVVPGAKSKSKRSHSNAKSKVNKETKRASRESKSPNASIKETSKAKTGSTGASGNHRKGRRSALSKETVDTDSFDDSSDDEALSKKASEAKVMPVASQTKPAKKSTKNRKQNPAKTDEIPLRNHDFTADENSAKKEKPNLSRLSLNSNSSFLDLSDILDDVTAVPGKLLSPVPSVTNLPMNGDTRSNPRHSLTKQYSSHAMESETKAGAHHRGSYGFISSHSKLLDGLDVLDGVPSICVRINLALLDMNQDSLRTHSEDLRASTQLKKEMHQPHGHDNVFSDIQRDFHPLGDPHKPRPLLSPIPSQDPFMDSCVPMLHDPVDSSKAGADVHLTPGSKTGNEAPQSRRSEPPIDYSSIVGIETRQPPTSLKIPKKNRPAGRENLERPSQDSGATTSLKRRPPSDERHSRERADRKRRRAGPVDPSGGSPQSSPWSQRSSDYDPPKDALSVPPRWARKGSDYTRDAPTTAAQSPNTHSPYWSNSEYRTPRHDNYSDRESIRGDEPWNEPPSSQPHHRDSHSAISSRDTHHNSRDPTSRDSSSRAPAPPSHKYATPDDRDKWRDGSASASSRYRSGGERRSRERGGARDRSRERYEQHRDRRGGGGSERRGRDSIEREGYERERTWERESRGSGRDYDHDAEPRKRPRKFSRDWDAPLTEVPPGIDGDYDGPPAISPYHSGGAGGGGGGGGGESKARVANEWGMISAGHSTEPPSSRGSTGMLERGGYDRYEDDRVQPYGSASRYPPSSSSSRDSCRPKPIPPINTINDTDFYLNEAKNLKHKADETTEKVTKLILYIEAVLSFIMCGYAMELNKLYEGKINTMYCGTLKMLKFVWHISSAPGNDHTEYQDRIKKLAVFSLRIQALLCLRLYNLKKAETSKLKGIIDEHNKEAKQAAKSTTMQAPSPYTGGHSGWKGTSGTPSPMSPQPSPGSVASVGSAGSSGDSQPKVAAAAAGNVSSTTVCVPTRIHSVTAKYLEQMNNLYQCHDLWDQADKLIDDKEFFARLDADCGPLSFQSSVPDIVHYFKNGTKRLEIT